MAGKLRDWLRDTWREGHLETYLNLTELTNSEVVL
jgi:hypothetical protein